MLSRNFMQGVGGRQPSASDMFELKWNNELAKVAQRWADQCTWHHDAERVTAPDERIIRIIYVIILHSHLTTGHEQVCVRWPEHGHEQVLQGSRLISKLWRLHPGLVRWGQRLSSWQCRRLWKHWESGTHGTLLTGWTQIANYLKCPLRVQQHICQSEN